MNNKMMIISPMYVNYNQFLLINRSLLHRTILLNFECLKSW